MKNKNNDQAAMFYLFTRDEKADAQGSRELRRQRQFKKKEKERKHERQRQWK